MIIDNKQTTVAYRCPDCGSWVTGIAGLFSLSADMLKLKCPCGESRMDIIYGKDRKIRLNIPCFTCPSPHSFTVSSGIFFSNDLFCLSCPYSGVDICLIGEKGKVSDAIKEADEILSNLMAEAGYNSLDEIKNDRESQVFTDPQILEIVNFVIRDLDESGNISCNCEDDEGLYSVDITDDGIIVRCENCGAKTLVPVTSTISAQAFLNCDKLILK